MNFQLTEQQRQLVDSVHDIHRRKLHELCKDDSGEGIARLRREMADHGLLGLNLPEPLGGVGLSLLDTVLLIQNLQACSSTLGALSHRSSTGAVGAIVELGTDEQKRRFVGRVCQGEIGIGIGITEPEAGSAATALRTSARIDGDHVVINGKKQFVSFVNHNHFTVVYCRFGDSGSPKDIGAVIVPHDAPGFSHSRGTLNMADELLFELYFDDCRVPRENILADGNAFGRLISVYNAERLGSIARMLGSAQASYGMAVEYSKTRRQFNREISDFQGIQWMLADMRVKLEAAQLLTYRAAAGAGEHGLPVPFETSIAKVYTAQAAKEICDDAIQIHGANGYTKEYPLAHRYAEVRGGSIYGGTLQIHKNMIASVILDRPLSQWKKSR
ncbi:acyl-CoA dehydrogenase [Azospirillum sp. RWY-5-1]|uniref:Acyl-CoA dehydrogenase n=1 Tax=Azospirillum oleiclasticum TaxID=2735135 RepID=A0ABX2TI46_9PROT|nr:acyl-CoA dehydrogenase family protein [Azospirillum oleiclasticum]NYZ16534.1 acyl-CoA dehydrogenase [Azospirillum oleiclasticum]NYZ23996.1 acyl-CoA dehydrogenase [Azospirillum oleiclasticum]